MPFTTAMPQRDQKICKDNTKKSQINAGRAENTGMREGK